MAHETTEFYMKTHNIGSIDNIVALRSFFRIAPV
jgi:hypothetical protein